MAIFKYVYILLMLGAVLIFAQSDSKITSTTSKPSTTSVTVAATSSTSVSTLSSSSNFPSSTPIFVPGDSTWTLLGCYNELPANSSARALGITGSYISPVLSSPDALTVPGCLDGCGVALSPNGAGAYPYAAVEDSR